MYRIESLLSARLFLQPQVVGNRIYFLSNMSGHISLYAMNHGGSVPEPLLPPHIALQNPHLIDGESFCVYPELGQILVMIDKDGDENYQPMILPIEGGFPEPAFPGIFENYRVHCSHCDASRNLAYFVAESRQEQKLSAHQASLETGQVRKLGEGMWGPDVDGVSQDHRRAVLIDSYTSGDHVLYLWEDTKPERRLLYGTPIDERKPGEEVPYNAISSCHFTPSGLGLIFVTALFDDHFSLGHLAFANPSQIQPVTTSGVSHTGDGELTELRHLHDNRYLLRYNIDGCSWVYEGLFDEKAMRVQLGKPLVGTGELANGVLEAIHFDETDHRFALAFSSATSPTQIYTLEGDGFQKVLRHTNERILGVNAQLFSAGEDASFTSYDGMKISARLYLPAAELGFRIPHPLVYYVHGGPQSQERPDFAWFSMPLIQYLTLNGFAVFVPNVRGSSGYGLSYTKKVDRDWGGNDRLDHVYAMQNILTKDKRLDVSRAGVVGRSYGGYMTLMLASRHPELWNAAVDMFGPYDLVTFMERIPETWKPYFAIAVGDPEKDRELLIERSPTTYMSQITCPMMVIQGKNDPRVVERESLDLVERLRREGKQIEYLMFENEGHDVLKFDNRVRAYQSITDFFKKNLEP